MDGFHSTSFFQLLQSQYQSFSEWGSAPITIVITTIFMFYCFFSCHASFRYLSLFSFSFSFALWSTGNGKSTFWQLLFFHYYVIFFSHDCMLIDFYLSLSDSKSSQLSKTVFSILDDLYAIVWTVSIGPPIFSLSSTLSKRLGAVPNLPITTNITVTLIIIIIIIIIIYSLEFFPSALASGLSLEFEWQQVSSSLEDSFQYSSHS